MGKLLLVDGSNLLFQMFYGMPARIVNSRGKAIQGTLGFVGALRRILAMVQPTHAAVLFDGECHNPRKDLDGDYKANRPDYSQMAPEETPFSQLPDILAALDFLGIAYAETADCEADDWIAGYARSLGDEMELVICSQDSDFFQLITPSVQILRYRGKASRLCDAQYICQRYGILPSQYADYKAMVGDPADNIRGARLIGPKTAALLLRQFGDLDGILQNIPQVARPAIRASLAENAGLLRHNRLLIRLTGEAPLPFPIQSLEVEVPKLTAFQVLQAANLW